MSQTATDLTTLLLSHWPDLSHMPHLTAGEPGKQSVWLGNTFPKQLCNISRGTQTYLVNYKLLAMLLRRHYLWEV